MSKCSNHKILLKLSAFVIADAASPFGSDFDSVTRFGVDIDHCRYGAAFHFAVVGVNDALLDPERTFRH